MTKHHPQMYYYLHDANGNVGQLVSSADGSIAAHYEYDPFGNVVFSYGSEADNNVYRFSTKFFDAETGMYYYGFRYYLPELGRWVNRDPIEEDGFKFFSPKLRRWMRRYPTEEEWGVNLYSFILNSSLDSIDFLGLRNLTLHIYYNLPELEPASKKEVKEIFNRCFDKVKCCHKVKIEFHSTTKTVEGIKTGKKGAFLGFNPDEITFYIDERTLGRYGATGRITLAITKGYYTTLDYVNIDNKAATNGWDEHIVRAVVIAHEIGLHAISGEKDRITSGTDDVDDPLPRGNKGQSFSNKGCDEILDELDIDG